MPVPNLSLTQMQDITRELLISGASIADINLVRRSLCNFKQGGLVKDCAAEVLTLAISDVVGNPPLLIASGPTIINDKPYPEKILALVHALNLSVPPEVQKSINRQQKQNQRRDNPYYIIASSTQLLEAAKHQVLKLGYSNVHILDNEEGEASVVAKKHAKLVKALVSESKSIVLITGGELTVTLDQQNDDAKGGPNQEYLLALALEMGNEYEYHGVAVDTDGIDGNTNVAGAYINHSTLQRASSIDIDPRMKLSKHNSFEFFQSLNDAISLGPTGTNVNDLRVILLMHKSSFADVQT
jgi:hydroxypyruvate reductase